MRGLIRRYRKGVAVSFVVAVALDLVVFGGLFGLGVQVTEPLLWLGCLTIGMLSGAGVAVVEQRWGRSE